MWGIYGGAVGGYQGGDPCQITEHWHGKARHGVGHGVARDWHGVDLKIFFGTLKSIILFAAMAVVITGDS